MATNSSSHLKGWEYPAGSAIKIREVINCNNGKDFSVSYRVSIPAKLAGTRILKQFADADETWAEQQHEGFLSNGKVHFDLNTRERDDAIKALAILRGSSLTLSGAASFARAHFKPARGAVTVKEAIKQMLAEKTAENLRYRTIADLKAA